MKGTLLVAAIVGVHALACLSAGAEVISYTMGIEKRQRAAVLQDASRIK